MSFFSPNRKRLQRAELIRQAGLKCPAGYLDGIKATPSETPIKKENIDPEDPSVPVLGVETTKVNPHAAELFAGNRRPLGNSPPDALQSPLMPWNSVGESALHIEPESENENPLQELFGDEAGQRLKQVLSGYIQSESQKQQDPVYLETQRQKALKKEKLRTRFGIPDYSNLLTAPTERDDEERLKPPPDRSSLRIQTRMKIEQTKREYLALFKKFNTDIAAKKASLASKRPVDCHSIIEVPSSALKVVIGQSDANEPKRQKIADQYKDLKKDQQELQLERCRKRKALGCNSIIDAWRAGTTVQPPTEPLPCEFTKDGNFFARIFAIPNDCASAHYRQVFRSKLEAEAVDESYKDRLLLWKHKYKKGKFFPNVSYHLNDDYEAVTREHVGFVNQPVGSVIGLSEVFLTLKVFDGVTTALGRSFVRIIRTENKEIYLMAVGRPTLDFPLREELSLHFDIHWKRGVSRFRGPYYASIEELKTCQWVIDLALDSTLKEGYRLVFPLKAAAEEFAINLKYSTHLKPEMYPRVDGWTAMTEYTPLVNSNRHSLCNHLFGVNGLRLNAPLDVFVERFEMIYGKDREDEIYEWSTRYHSKMKRLNFEVKKSKLRFGGSEIS